MKCIPAVHTKFEPRKPTNVVGKGEGRGGRGGGWGGVGGGGGGQGGGGWASLASFACWEGLQLPLVLANRPLADPGFLGGVPI